jgi:hypothetical protein
MNNCQNKTDIFSEALSHCRWEKVLRQLLSKIKLQEYENNTFEQILTVYDIVSGICSYHQVNINKVYIIGIKSSVLSLNY